MSYKKKIGYWSQHRIFHLKRKKNLFLKETKSSVQICFVMLVSELRSITQISLKADRIFASPSALMSSETHMHSLHGKWGRELVKHFHIWFWNGLEKELTPQAPGSFWGRQLFIFKIQYTHDSIVIICILFSQNLVVKTKGNRGEKESLEQHAIISGKYNCQGFDLQQSLFALLQLI